MSHDCCPSDAVLSSYAVGTLDGDAWDHAADHVRACRRCVERLDQLTPRDSLLDALRRYSDATPIDPAYLRVAAGLIGRSTGGQLDPGTRLNEYRILELLGQGGMGAVYKARHDRLDKLVAVKVLNCGASPENLARFSREMKAIGRLRHPHVAAATDAGEADGVLYLVMEYLEGLDLAKLVRSRGPMRWPDACEAVRQAALGLAHAHSAGLVHRDVKPSNLILGAEGTIKVLDLGLAVWSNGSRADSDSQVDSASATVNDDDLTGSNRTVGTYGYMAPEQVSDPHAVDARADVFGLGRTLVHLLTGRTPVDTTAVPANAAALLRKLTAENPNDRFPDAASVALALRPLTRGADLAALAAGIAPARHRWTAIGAVAAILVVASAITWAHRTIASRSPAEAESEPVAAVVDLPPPAPKPAPQPGEMPMSPAAATDLQQTWSSYHDRPPISEGPDGLRFALVPPGTLMVSPTISTVLSKPYEMAVNEVTVGQFREFVVASGHRTEGVANGLGSLSIRLQGRSRRGTRSPGYRWDAPGFDETSDALPVVHVSWHDARAYCEWLSNRAGSTYRLPTLAEWRWALQAGSLWATEHAVVKEIMVAAYDPTKLPAQPMPVGERKPNAWGLHDMMGNVEEWTTEFYHPAGSFDSKKDGNPIGPTTVGAEAWAAGGSYLTWPINQATRTHYSLRYSSSAVGFRVVREIAKVPAP